MDDLKTLIKDPIMRAFIIASLLMFGGIIFAVTAGDKTPSPVLAESQTKNSIETDQLFDTMEYQFIRRSSGTIIAGVFRLENSEVICYATSKGIDCKFKGGK